MSLRGFLMNGSYGTTLGEGFANEVASFGFNYGGNFVVKRT